ncbi:hypothetical protein BDB01DRAFT_727631 [Pilobolus umbonatus]|nr:hypothetical protein BDB01DRAFT_727631 [Pilobolus umbonatus]
MADIKARVRESLDQLDTELREISLRIHRDPELGDHEYHAYELLSAYLEKKGLKVSRGVVGLETAFMAEYSNGSGRSVGFCSEYDALPGVGHACGHNLIAIQGLACALTMKSLMEQGLVQGRVVLFGTPAEESTSGKINFVKEHVLQNKVDVAMMLHPFAQNSLYSPMLALDSLDVEFFGKESHAGMAPWKGINAVDAVMQGLNNVAMLRQQTLASNRLHGIITHGGEAANVIPAYASVHFYARALTRDQLTGLKPKVENCFKAAALASGCTYKLAWASKGMVEDVFLNETMSAIFKQYMEEEGIVYRSRSEEEKEVSASTDMGNFSYAVPAIHPAYSIHTTAANHTKEFTEAAKTEIAHKDTLRAAQCLILTAVDVMNNDSVYEQVVSDFQKGKTV